MSALASRRQWDCYLAGEAVSTTERLAVTNPYDGRLVGETSWMGPEYLERLVSATTAAELSRYQRSQILSSARDLLARHAEEFASLICSEAGLCMRETRYEVGRAGDVLQFAAMEALRDDGQIFSCDVSPQGKPRRIYTTREPLLRALAITPFNHPLNQVVHKLAPAVAAGTPLILKPSEKTPLTAIRFTELLYEAGLPGSMLSVVLGPIDSLIEPLIEDPRIELVSFTGSAAIGRKLAGIAGYKRLCLELGGNSPLIILPDADLEFAVRLAAEGCYRNSGQRCTAVKRLLVHQDICDEFAERLVEKTAEYVTGDPADEATRVGTVIDEAAAMRLESVVTEAVEEGARLRCGGVRQGATYPPTVLTDVPRGARMVVEESFGPLAPVISVADLDDAIEVANSTAYGLSSGIVTNDLEAARRAIRGIRTGTVNVNEVPGYRIESSPFGGVKDSGLGIKEGVIEALKFMTTVKTYSMPW